MEKHHSNHGHYKSESQIKVNVSYVNGIIKLSLVDDEGYAPKLALNHDKLIHLIIVSEDLNEFFHLHPVQKDSHSFQQEITLTGSSYRAFVDINPKGKNYIIEPIPFSAGDDSYANNHMHHGLNIDKQNTKEINGKIVEFKHQQLEAGRDLEFHFKIKNATPQPYLGALGHVVIIDEKVENFIHVHPTSDKNTIFQAYFDKSGKYKLWAEFKFDDEVFVYPYVIEVN